MKQNLCGLDDNVALERELASRDISVASPAKRTKEQRETYCVFRLIAMLNKHGNLGFPFSACPISQRFEPPDYELKCGDQSVGLEHTDAISGVLARIRKVQEKEFPELRIRSRFIGQLEENSTDAEICSWLRQKPLDQGGGSTGYFDEMEWAKFVINCCEKKEARLARWFKRFDECWLLVHMNIEVRAEIHAENWPAGRTAPDYCKDWINNRFRKAEWFDRVFVLDRDAVVEFSADGVSVSPVPCLWNRS